MIDRVFGNYRIVARLGDGGMGSVFRAVDQMLDREVAIKVLRPDLARQTALVERFRQEAKALARLSHPNIATLHGLEQHGDELLMIMEYVRGDTLEAIVERSGQLAWPRACELCIGVLQALDHAHDMSVVHRDIKPANIMLAANGMVKVMDFGIARMLGRSRQTQFGHAVGTPLYMAPEQLRGQEVDGRTDLYAVGAVLFELITGRMAFDADSDYSLMMKKLNDPPTAPSVYVPEVPSLVDAIVLRAMHTAPEHRFPNAQAFVEELQRAVALAPARVSRVTPAATRLAVDTPPPTRLAEVAVTQSRPQLVAEPPASVPMTRVVTPAPYASFDAHGVSTPAPQVPPATPRTLLTDWRSYAAASVLLASVALGVQGWRGRSGPGVAPATTDTSATTVAIEPAPAAPAPREDASSLIISGGRPAAPVVPAPSPIVTDAPPSRRGSERAPRERAISPSPIDRAPEPLPGPSPETPPAPAPAPGPSENAGAARAAIQDAVRGALRSLDEQSAAASLLQGAVKNDWLSLAKEGRISVSPIGAADIELRGGDASASIDTEVSTRSPFGANRKRVARFVAELRRDAGGWRVVSVRPSGGLSLK